jgi:hypothetical protein
MPDTDGDAFDEVSQTTYVEVIDYTLQATPSMLILTLEDVNP